MIVVLTIFLLCSIVMMVTEDEVESTRLYGFAVIFFSWCLAMYYIANIRPEYQVELLNPQGQVEITNGSDTQVIDVELIPLWIEKQEL